MNKNKLIFALIAGGIVFLLAILFFFVGGDKQNNNQNISGAFKIWLFKDDPSEMSDFIEGFKATYPQYEKANISVESFSSYEDYSMALSWAIVNDQAPDIFVLNNNEKNAVFANQSLGLDNTRFSTNDFRQKYKNFFADDLIYSTEIDGEEVEFLIGVPIGYETLGIFYNKAHRVKSSDLSSMTSLNNTIKTLSERDKDTVPLGIGNGSTVYGVSDILTQFLMNETVKQSVSELDNTIVQKAIGKYLLYGDYSGDNKYDNRFVEMTKFGQNNIDLFTQTDISMIIGFPRMIEEIDKKGFKKNFLFATPFPQNASGEGNTLVEYNYFALNKESKNIPMAQDILQYMMSDNGASIYLDDYQYYLPGLLSLEDEILEEKIHDDYNIILKNFFNPQAMYSSFDKGVKQIYDRSISGILDNPTGFSDKFEILKQGLTCRSNKFVNGEGLGESCE